MAFNCVWHSQKLCSCSSIRLCTTLSGQKQIHSLRLLWRISLFLLHFIIECLNLLFLILFGLDSVSVFIDTLVYDKLYLNWNRFFFWITIWTGNTKNSTKPCFVFVAGVGLHWWIMRRALSLTWTENGTKRQKFFVFCTPWHKAAQAESTVYQYNSVPVWQARPSLLHHCVKRRKVTVFWCNWLSVTFARPSFSHKGEVRKV